MLTIIELANLKRRRGDGLLHQLEPLPDPLRSSGELRRYANGDVSEKTDRELWRELRRVEMRLALDNNPHSWLIRRFDALSTEQTRRGAR
jgi:hypothetical protein